MLYEQLNTRCDLSISGVEWALGQLRYDRPTLYVHPSQMRRADQIAAIWGLNVKTHHFIKRDEWVVEWANRRVGSEGA